MDDVKETMSKVRHRDFPVLDDEWKICRYVFQTKSFKFTEKTGDPC